VAGKPFWRISRLDLDKLMTALEVNCVRLSGYALAAGAQLIVARSDIPTIYYGLEGAGCILVDDEPPIRLRPHTLVIASPNKSVRILGSEYASAPHLAPRKLIDETCISGSPHRHRVGDGAPRVTFVCGHFQAVYGGAVALFASLASPIVEIFDPHDQLDQVMNYAMAELAAREIDGGPMSKALFKLVLLALLRRSLVSAKPWVERFSILSDPPVARAFAEMASRPSAQHTVPSLSRFVGLSRSAFMARFASAFGESPMSVLRRLRMRHAAALLTANVLSIDQVALHAGYQSRSSFTRTFRKHYGSDPSEYRAGRRRLVGSDASELMNEPIVPEEMRIAD
jgi:AraC family transcriptional activator of mtrCDE